MSKGNRGEMRGERATEVEGGGGRQGGQTDRIRGEERVRREGGEGGLGGGRG